MSPNNKNPILPEIESLFGLSEYNTLILDYFMYMGYKKLYIAFCEDLNIKCTFSPLFLRRAKIRDLLENGEIDEAIEELNDLDVELYSSQDIYVHFVCHKAYEQKTTENEVEIIKSLKDTLGNLVLQCTEQIEDLLEYLIFNSSNIQIEELRVKLADYVNDKILEQFNIEENKLIKIIENIFSKENILSKKNKFIDFKESILKLI